MEMIELDGGQGGGQLLRSALSLSLCTGIGFTMQHIRARRSRPGLMRQHLTAVQAATAIGRAAVHGSELGATTLRFEPGTVRAGDYAFATGTAGSTTLIAQTLLPALLQAEGTSTLRLEGGTHNPMAPPADFLLESWLPTLAAMGVQAEVALDAYGFYPTGGGVLRATVQPCRQLKQVRLEQRGERIAVEGVALLSALSAAIGRRELDVLGARLGLPEEALQLRSVRPSIGPGNAVMVHVRHAAHTEVFTGFGESGVWAEKIAERVATEAAVYLASSAFAGEHLADQLLLPMALAGGGSFTTVAITDHLASNARLVEKFLPVEIEWTQDADGAWVVRVAS
jgi:RNA 3'-terminal phosphate cyclase (ATP)